MKRELRAAPILRLQPATTHPATTDPEPLDWTPPLETRQIALFFFGTVLVAIALGAAVIVIITSMGSR